MISLIDFYFFKIRKKYSLIKNKMEDNNVEEENENSENQEEKEEEEDIEKSDSISENKNKRILVYARIRPFTQFEEKIDKTTPFKSIDVENNTIQCKPKKYY